jgi:hypothetical protein
VSRNAPVFALYALFIGGFVCAATLLARGGPPKFSTAAPVSLRARVVVAEDAAATDTFNPVPGRVHALVDRGIMAFTARTNVASAWRAVVSTQDIVGLKVFSSPGPRAGTRAVVVEAVVAGLLAARIPPRNIIIWDRRVADLRRAGFDEMAQRHGVRLAGSLDEGWSEEAFYETSLLGSLVFGDLEFQKKGDAVGRKSFVTKLLSSNVTKIINIPPVLNHNSVGVCGNLYSLTLGSVDNTIRFEGDTARLAQAVPEIYALPALGDRVVLNIVDALICQYQGEEIGRLHYSAALNQIRFSTDPVALDVLSIRELDRQRQRTMPEVQMPTNRMELYRNAELLELGISDPARIDVEMVPAK